MGEENVSECCNCYHLEIPTSYDIVEIISETCFQPGLPNFRANEYFVASVELLRFFSSNGRL